VSSDATQPDTNTSCPERTTFVKWLMGSGIPGTGISSRRPIPCMGPPLIDFDQGQGSRIALDNILGRAGAIRFYALSASSAKLGESEPASAARPGLHGVAAAQARARLRMGGDIVGQTYEFFPIAALPLPVRCRRSPVSAWHHAPCCCRHAVLSTKARRRSVSVMIPIRLPPSTTGSAPIL